MLVVRRDEHDLRPFREARQHTCQRHTIQAGHLDVAEHHVNGRRVQGAQGVGTVGRGPDVPDPLVLAQQVGQLGQRRGLVVNHQRPQAGDGWSRVL